MFLSDLCNERALHNTHISFKLCGLFTSSNLVHAYLADCHFPQQNNDPRCIQLQLDATRD